MALGDARPEDAAELAGVRDGFERLWTPHRMAYISGAKPTPEDEGECPFCTAPRRSDEQGLIVHRGQHCYAVLNLFPYNPGHLLICPYRHVPLYVDLATEELTEFSELTRQALRALEQASAPAGFNVGINQGEVAGAGLAAHLHQHIVPRWGGDMNFLPVVGQTKALPMLLADVRDQLVAAWPQGEAPPAG